MRYFPNYEVRYGSVYNNEVKPRRRHASLTFCRADLGLSTEAAGIVFTGATLGVTHAIMYEYEHRLLAEFESYL